MANKSSFISDGLWNAATQGVAAIGQLIGIRLLTDFLPPEVYGTTNLLTGIALLISTGFASPTLQAMLRFYPEYRNEGRGWVVRKVAHKQLLQILVWMSPFIILGFMISVSIRWVTVIQLILISLLVMIDLLRMEGMALLNAVAAHRAYGVWSLLESWCRPLVSVLLIKYTVISVEMVLVGFLLTSCLSWYSMYRYVPLDQEVAYCEKISSDLKRRIWVYTAPLLPLGMVGWVSGIADRYLIATFLSPADVGLYVAMYGLASRPMLMLGNVLELTFRPGYQQALANGDNKQANMHLKSWLILLGIGCVVVILPVLVMHKSVATLLLGESYRGASNFLPWIMLGYAFLVFSHVPVRVCYAYGKTNHVLVIEVAGAIAAMAFALILILLFGLIGAVYAIPIYFGIQLAVSIMCMLLLLKRKNK